MGSSSKQTVGYWYRLALHFGLCRAPVDALLEMRVGDRTAWAGQVSSNTTLTVNLPELFGGTKSEGGLQGDMDVLMGAPDQGVNAYLAGLFGPGQGAYRGRVSVVWKGGRWGAMNPYPKPAAFKLRRASSSWYPAKAQIQMVAGGTEVLPWVNGHDPRAAGNTHEYRPATSGVGPWYASVAEAFAAAGWDIAGADALLGWSPDKLQLSRAFPGNVPGAAASLFLHFNRYAAATYFQGMTPVGSALVCASFLGEDVQIDGPRLWWNGRLPGGAPSPNAPVSLQHQGVYRLKSFVLPLAPGETGINNCTNYPPTAGYFPQAVYSPDRMVEVRRSGRVVDVVAMNPAHILYDSLVDGDMMGEPPGAVNEASFIAAADALFNEGFGLCTSYDATRETIEEFQQRICNVAGLALSRDRRTGLWTLDMVRGAGDPAGLPVLGDDDILDFAREPGAMDDAVSQLALRWFDPLRKETRTAGPVQALGHIQAFGGVVSETADYPEIPLESLALRVAARDLRNRATPLARLDLRTTRVAWAWRTGTYFRLQAPKRGIADMVCMVSEIDIGTLRQGAIALVAVQDVFSMPATTYVVPQPPVAESGSAPPSVPALQRLFEAPYLSLASVLLPGELAALAVDAGFVAAVASRPAAGWAYTLLTAATGEPLQARGSGDWTPVCVASAAAGPLDATLTVVDAVGLDGLALPVAALWDAEIVRVDAVDLVAGMLTLGRGCGDTVPASHPPGSVLYVFGAAVGTDEREYAAGETVTAKVISVAAGASLPEGSAPLLATTMDGRQGRPYPPARMRINGEAAPLSMVAPLTVTWAHRSRVLQADQLIDTEMASVGPEPGTSYNAYAYDAVTGALLTQQLGITGTTWAPALPAGMVRLELESQRDGLVSWQRQVHVVEVLGSMVLQEGAAGIVLLETGGGLMVDPFEPPAPMPHQLTISVGGSFSAADHIRLSIALDAGPLSAGGSTRIFEVSAAGLASLEALAAAMAQELFSVMLLAPYLPFRVSVSGTNVVLSTVWQITSVRVDAAWASTRVELRQAPLPASAGVAEQSWIDLYVGGTATELAAPYWSGGATGPQYDDTGPAAMKLWVTGATWAARKAIGGVPGPMWGVDVIDVYWTQTAPQSRWLEALVGNAPTLPSAINALPQAATYGMAADVGTWGPFMSREAVTISMAGEFQLLPDHPVANGVSADREHPSLAEPFVRRYSAGAPAWPAGARQLSTLLLSYAVGSVPAAGQHIVLTLGGVDFDYACTGAESGVEDIADGLAALIEPGGLYTVDWYAPLGLIEVERTTADVPFTMAARATYGVIVTPTIDY